MDTLHPERNENGSGENRNRLRPSRSWAQWLVTGGIFLLAGGGTLAGYWAAETGIRGEIEHNFDLAAERVAARVTQQLDQLTQAARAVAGFLDASDQVDPDEWDRFIATLDHAARVPGYRGVLCVQGGNGDGTELQLRFPRTTEAQAQRDWVAARAASLQALINELNADPSEPRLATIIGREGSAELVVAMAATSGARVRAAVDGSTSSMDSCVLVRMEMSALLQRAMVAERMRLSAAMAEETPEVVAENVLVTGREIGTPGGPWHLQMMAQPTDFASRAELLAPALTLAAGTATTLLIAGCVWFAWNERNKALALSEARAAATKAARRSMEVAQTASAAKSAFLARMSHEIRTPMTAILGYADLLNEDQHDPIRRAEYVTTIRRNGEHLLSLVNDVLDLSKIEAGDMKLERAEMDVVQIVRDMVGLMRVRASDKGLNLRAEFAWPLPRRVLGDEMRLKQILLNLVGNAVKFTSAGEIVVRVKLDATGRRLEFAVSDTGIGLSAEQMARLFRPFQQGDVTTARQYGGTGLGLTISREFARLMNGDVRAASGPTGGAVFTLDLNLDDAALRMLVSGERDLVTEAGRAAPTSRLDGLRVLLAEDGVDNQRLIRHVLERSGAQVEVVMDGQKAVAAAQVRAFDLVLLDMQMPVMDGYAAARNLRTEGFAGPIVAITANAMAGDRQRCLEAGCTDYLTKPIDRTLLLETCRAACAAGRGRAAA